MAQDRQKIMAAGFDGFQGKPISVRELLATMRGILDRSSAASTCSGRLARCGVKAADSPNVLNAYQRETWPDTQSLPSALLFPKGIARRGHAHHDSTRIEELRLGGELAADGAGLVEQ